MTDSGGELLLAAGPLEMQVGADQRLRFGWRESDWFGPVRLTGEDVVPGEWARASDGSISNDAGWVRASVRSFDDTAIVLRLEALTDRRAPAEAGAFESPVVAWSFEPDGRADDGAPADLRAFGHQYTEFALPVFSDAAMQRWRLLPFRPAVVMPLGLAAPDDRTLLLAPLDSFHEQVIVVPDRRHGGRRTVDAGWHGDIGAVPAGFATEFAVIHGRGPRECFATWARLLRDASQVVPPARDSDVLGTRLSYWTDNGSAYWYRTAPGLDPASTVVAAVDDLEARGLPIASVQLDSWWYPHEVLRPFDTDEWEVPPTGMVRWEPRPDVLPDGVAALRERLGRRPLVTHTRHLSSQSPYVEQFATWIDGDRAHPQHADLYERLLDQAVAWGVEVFEHDWLIECFLGVRDLRGAGRARAWQRGLDRALTARGLHAQWCMASPADFAQASELRNITSIRTSGDHGYLVGPEVLWAWFLHTNVLARALGLWPYKDVFHSSLDHPEREVEALLSALSGGPVGVGDRIGEADIGLVRRTCRADGVLVRPDVPVAAIDRSMYDAPVWSGELAVGSAHTDHAAGRWGYVVTANVGMAKEPASTTVALHDLGDDVPASDRVAVYDWRRRAVAVAARDDAHYDVALETTDWDYRILAPVLAGDIAVIGDPALYASAGDTRIADVVVRDGLVTVTVLGAGERVDVVGWAATAPSARTWSPSTGATDTPVVHDPATGVWTATVDIGDTGWTQLQLRP